MSILPVSSADMKTGRFQLQFEGRFGRFTFVAHLLRKLSKTNFINCLLKKTRIDLYEIKYKSLG